MGVDYILQKLGFHHARTTIPKWLQRGVMDPLDKVLSVLIKKLGTALQDEKDKKGRDKEEHWLWSKHLHWITVLNMDTTVQHLYNTPVQHLYVLPAAACEFQPGCFLWWRRSSSDWSVLHQ